MRCEHPQRLPAREQRLDQTGPLLSTSTHFHFDLRARCRCAERCPSRRGAKQQPEGTGTFGRVRRKYTGLYKYGLLSWDIGGQNNQREFITGNYDQSDLTIPRTVAHELGHTRGLLDYPRPQATTTAEACPTGPNAVTQRMAFSYPSNMNAEYYSTGLGFATLVDPTVSPISCSPSAPRFSKGLGNALTALYSPGAVVLESAIVEGGPSNWAWRRFVADIQCHRDSSCLASRWTSAKGTACTTTQCCIDWDEDASPCETAAQSKDLDHDDSWRWSPPGGGQDGLSANDALRDRNDWGEMLAKFHYNIDEMSEPNFDVFATGFNDATLFNFSGAPVSTSGTWQAVDGVYPVNRCTASVGCSSTLGCATDACTTSTTCRLATSCSEGACNCSTDADCWSERCLSTGLCEVGEGICRCSGSQHCRGYTCLAGGRCESTALTFGKAAQLSGGASGSQVRLLSGGSGNAVDLMDASVDYAFDVKPYGFAAGETVQTLLETRTFRVEVIPVATEGKLILSLRDRNGVEKVRYPKTGETPLSRGRWYNVRASWDSAQSKVVLSVKVWDEINITKPNAPFGLSHKLYTNEICHITTGVSFASSGGDIVFGGRATGGTRFRGELENVNVYNGARFPTITCTP